MNFNQNKHLGKILGTILNHDVPVFLQQNKNITTWILNDYIEQKIMEYKTLPFLKNYIYEGEKYNFASCISINEELVHTRPNRDKVINNNDIVKVDLVISNKNKDLVDSARSFYYINNITKIDKKKHEIFLFVEKFLIDFFNIQVLKQNHRDIYYVLLDWIEHFKNFRNLFNKKFKQNINVVPNLCGHFIGKKLHMNPLLYFDEENIKNTQRHKNLKINDKFCLEPVLIVGNNTEIKTYPNKFKITSHNTDNNISFHYENTYFFNNKWEIKVLTI